MNSRQAINLLKDLEQSLDDYCELNDEGKAAFRMAITALELFGNAEQLPSAQPEPQWIPVSDRLPEEGQSILVTTTNGWHMVAIIRTFFKDMHKDIIAWMPLPEPYRAERRTDEGD